VASSDTTDSTFGTLADGGAVYFVGLVETDALQAFHQRNLHESRWAGIPFNIDDIITTTTSFAHTSPKLSDESSTLGLFLAGCACLLFLRRASYLICGTIPAHRSACAAWSGAPF